MTGAEQLVSWTQRDGVVRSAPWLGSGFPAPKSVIAGEDTLRSTVAHRLASEGTGIIWQGDYQNARQLLSALGRRVDRKRRTYPADRAVAFHQYRQRQAQRARVLGLLAVPVEPGGIIPLRRAPDVGAACAQAGFPTDQSFVLPLRDLLGIIGAYEWRRRGVPVPALDGARIHPHYGVFAPVRGEYVDLVARAPLPTNDLAWDIGTGTGVLAAVLAHRGVSHVVASERNAVALDCARQNVARLGFADRVDVVTADLFPDRGRAPLVVCNPPWLPVKPTSSLEQGVYDPGSIMLRGFLGGLREHLTPGGEGWLILSDLAERLGLRSREQLMRMFTESGVDVLDRLDTEPAHTRARDQEDPLHAERAAEITSLWRISAG